MDPVMLVEVLDVHGHVQVRHRVAGAGGQCRIGRSLDCEVVIDDPYAAPEHARLTLLGDGRVLVQDLGSRNGTRFAGEAVGADGRILTKGEVLVGRTPVRVRTPDGPLPPERRYRRDALRHHRTALAVAGVLLCLAFAGFLQWTHAPEQLGQRVVVALLAVIGGLAVWVGAWALVSRLATGAWQVRVHLAIAAFCIGLWVWGYWLYTVADFALQRRWVGPAMAALAALVAFAAAYLHLRNGTQFRRLVCAVLASVVPLLCGGVWWSLQMQIDPRTVNRVDLGASVYPPALRLAPSLDLADYLADAGELKRDANRNRQRSLLEIPLLDAEE
jgi:hypothetical protein